MTSVSSTSAASQTGQAAATSTSAFNNLGESDFLKLLTTQLSNQDPTAPVDNAQMLAQLAQFSTLAAANQTNTNLTTISGQISAATSAAKSAATTATTGTIA